MAKIEIELADDLLAWTTEASERQGLTVCGYIEMLLLLEGDLRRTTSDGRTLRTRAFIYRDGDHYFVEQPAHAEAQEV